MTTAYAWAPITKAEEQEDGTLLVYGPATNAALDRDQQRMDPAWLDQAMPKWFAEGGNIRESHDPKRAVGVAVGLHKAEGTDDWMLAARVVDPVAVAKVKHGVLKGYSIGIKNPHITFGKADAPNGIIDGGDVIETSLADRPSNPTTLFTMAKADGSGELADVEEPEVEELEDDEDETPAEEAAETEAEQAQEDENVTKAETIVGELVTVLGLTKADDLVQAVKDLVKEDPEPEAEAVEEQAEAEETKADAPDLSKVDGAYLTKADADAMLVKAVAEAIKPLEDRLAKAEAEAVLVKADLAKAMEMPVAGGPAATRTASQTAVARAEDAAALRAQRIATFIAKADASHDPTERQGYRDLANELKAKGDA